MPARQEIDARHLWSVDTLSARELHCLLDHAARLRRGPLSTSDAVPIGLEILAALSALHSVGIVHRDLQPSNVFLTAHGAKLLDFGLARPDPGKSFSDAGGLTRCQAICRPSGDQIGWWLSPAWTMQAFVPRSRSSIHSSQVGPVLRTRIRLPSGATRGSAHVERMSVMGVIAPFLSIQTISSPLSVPGRGT